MKSNSDKNQSKLPWWVELLFVQIGLPDGWLRVFLKKRKALRVFIVDNKEKVVYLAIAIVAVKLLLEVLVTPLVIPEYIFFIVLVFVFLWGFSSKK